MKNESGGFKELLKNGGFQGFLWTQFLGALNDNLYKMIVSMRAVHVAASTGTEYVAIALAVFVIPFFLFSGYSGQLADRLSKRSVLIGVKVFEIGVMLGGIAVFFSTRIEWMLVILFLMALHSTIFSPAKYGIVPEMLPDKDLSRANALLEMTTFVAIVMGTSLGALLFNMWKGAPWKMGVVMLGVAVVGFLASLRIPKVKPSGATAPFNFNPFGEVVTGTRHLLKDRPLWLTVIAISYFWFLGALFQSDLLMMGAETMHLDDLNVGLMVTSLAIGIGFGSMLAGRLSGDKVEIGLVPLGSVFMGLSAIFVSRSAHSFTLEVIALVLLGVSSGLFIVPLNAYLQQRSENEEKGRMIATNNFYNTLGLLLASAVLWGLHDKLHFAPEKLILWCGLVTLVATVFLIRAVPEFLMRFILWMTMHTIYRMKIIGRENIPLRGAALLVSNHVTHLDGFFIAACMQRFVRFMVWKVFCDMKVIGALLRFSKAIPAGTTGPRDVVASIRAAREKLKEGHVVCIFAEGSISRTGNLLPFKRGLEKIVDGLDVPIIPVHLDGLWGSVFSFEGGRFFWKWPKRFPFPMTVSFGAPMPSNSDAHQVRQAIAGLASDAVMDRKSRQDLLHLRFIRAARKNWSRFAMADSTGRELTYGRALTAAVMIARWARGISKGRLADARGSEALGRRSTPMHADDAQARGSEALQSRDPKGAVTAVGVLLPSSCGGALANIGLTMAGIVPVNLNFTAGPEAMASAIEQCGIKTIVTSRVFLEKAGIAEMPGMVYIEDIFASGGKTSAFLMARFAPKWMIASKCDPDSLATIIFSSGSTGTPKGVMLSHYNLISNIEAMVQVFWLTPDDRIIGVLPFFHSFGFTVTIWLPLISGSGVAYHANPTDAKVIGEIVQKYKGTLLLSTPTFCMGYSRKCTREQFASLRYVLVGAEKLRDSVRKTFEDAFGLELLEGYGCTEMSPVVAVNAPGYEAGKDSQAGTKAGTVGHPLPGVTVMIADPDTLEELGGNREGLLLVRGANRMLGYLGQPELTDSVLFGEWYRTGDLAIIDDEGFIRITDRLSRFSKIGGEMVPHLKIEEAVHELFDDFACAVTGIPDERRGERIALLFTREDVEPAEVWRRLSETELPKLWVPKRENIYRVGSLPTLGTGKADLRGIRAMAVELAARSEVKVAAD
jgi:acyl-[acyl-carrier-protein]-phospholipid O-acyltransferase / long-chain-fatty-acid--[acyl-carrier-protein] ligase